MNRFPLPHPDSEHLLLYADGELKPAEQAAVRRHLESCWKCRTELEELQLTVSGFIRYRERLHAARGPVSRQTSDQLRCKIARLQRELQAASPWRRAVQILAVRLVHVRRLAGLIAAAATAWAAIVLVQRLIPPSRPEPPVQQSAPVPAPKLKREPAPQPGVAVEPEPVMPKVIAPPPAAPDPATAEIAVLLKLHEIGADLGEPVEVFAAPKGIQIVCRQLAPEREAGIRAAIAAIPGVTVHTSLESQGRNARQVRGFVWSGSEGTPLERSLARELGGNAAFERLANELLEADEALMARFYALRAIEQRFPAERTASLNQADRALLAGIAADHKRAAREAWYKIERLLAQPIRVLRPPEGPVEAPSDADMFTAAKRLDRIVNVIFGGSATTLTGPQLGTELAAARAQMAHSLGEMQ